MNARSATSSSGSTGGALTIESGVPAAKRKAVAEALGHVLADTYVLYLKTHAYHWNVTGPDFPALHAMFEEQYEALAEAVDEIAERIRALGEPAPGSFAEFDRLNRIGAANDAETADAMVSDLARSNEAASLGAREALKVAQEAADEATADMLIGRMAAHDKVSWMLRATLA